MSSPLLRVNGAKAHNHYAVIFETVPESSGGGLASDSHSDVKPNQERGRSVRSRPAAEEAEGLESHPKYEENFC